MRLLRDNKGQMRVIEAFFASVLLLSSLTLIPMVQRSPNSGADSLSSTAMNVLTSLDSDGHLAELVDSGNWTALRSNIQSAVPVAVWFNLTVFGENMNQMNPYQISSGSPVSDRIEAADYACASTSPNYSLYVLRLQLAAVD